MRTPSRAEPARPRAGFTILEVVLAMGILFVGMTAVLGFLSVGAGLARTASLRSEASQSVEAVVADLEEALFPLVPGEALGGAGAPEPVRDRPVPGHPALAYSALATPEPDRDPASEDPAERARPLEYRVDVEISWSSAGARRSYGFTTLLLREVPFGERMRRRFVRDSNPPPAEDREEPRR